MPRWPIWRPAVFALAGLGLLTLSAVSVIGANEQAVILRMGAPERMINRYTAAPADHSAGAGVIAHIPFLERVVRLDRTLVSFAATGLSVRSAGQQKLQLDLLGQYRIIDPVRLVRTLGSQDRLANELATALSGLAQHEFGALDAAHVPLPGASGAWRRLTAALDAKARAFGAQVVDVRVQRVTLAQGAQQAAIARMKDEREAAALSISDEGLQQALQIRSDAEVEAARIIGASAARDPEFYDFYRAMSSYETMFGDPNHRDRATLILSPDSAYLKQMNGRAGSR
ncbi:MAG: hypothetical protein RLZZ84_655 [Pseudomonadota bacterium]